MKLLENDYKRIIIKSCYNITNVTTLALGLRPRQGLAKAQAKYEAQESHFMLP